MRNAAIPIAYHNDLNLAMKYVEKQSKVTHQGDEARGVVGYLLILCGKF